MKNNDDDEEEDDGKDDEKSISVKESHNEFGYRYYYTTIWCTNNNRDPYNIGYKYKDWYVNPRYDSLKDESLCSIDIEQWNEILEKANNYSQTDICKNLKAENGYKDSCGIEGDSIITINHIIAILLYTNFSNIEFVLNSTYRRNLSNAESNQSLKNRHSHLGWPFFTFFAMFFIFTDKLHKICKHIHINIQPI